MCIADERRQQFMCRIYTMPVHEDLLFKATRKYECSR